MLLLNSVVNCDVSSIKVAYGEAKKHERGAEGTRAARLRRRAKNWNSGEARDEKSSWEEASRGDERNADGDDASVAWRRSEGRLQAEEIGSEAKETW